MRTTGSTLVGTRWTCAAALLLCLTGCRGAFSNLLGGSKGDEGGDNSPSTAWPTVIEAGTDFECKPYTGMIPEASEGTGEGQHEIAHFDILPPDSLPPANGEGPYKVRCQSENPDVIFSRDFYCKGKVSVRADVTVEELDPPLTGRDAPQVFLVRNPTTKVVKLRLLCEEKNSD